MSTEEVEDAKNEEATENSKLMKQCLKIYLLKIMKKKQNQKVMK